MSNTLWQAYDPPYKWPIASGLTRNEMNRFLDAGFSVRVQPQQDPAEQAKNTATTIKANGFYKSQQKGMDNGKSSTNGTTAQSRPARKKATTI